MELDRVELGAAARARPTDATDSGSSGRRRTAGEVARSPTTTRSGCCRPDLVVPVGPDDEGRRRLDPAPDEAQCVERGLVGPVQVVEQEDEAAARLPERGQQRAEHVLARRPVADEARERRVEVRRRHRAAGLAAAASRAGRTSPGAIHVDGGSGRPERPQQRGLADARLALDEHQAPGTGRGLARGGGGARRAARRARAGAWPHRTHATPGCTTVFRMRGHRTRIRAPSRRHLVPSPGPKLVLAQLSRPSYTPAMIARPTRTDWLLLLALGIMWGTSYAFIKLGVETLPTFTLIATRLAIGLAFLVTVVAGGPRAAPAQPADLRPPCGDGRDQHRHPVQRSSPGRSSRSTRPSRRS